MKKSAIAFAMMVGLTSTSYATTIAGDAEAGKAKSATCAACHSADGNSMITTYPKIAGQSAEYLYKQLKDFKAGSTSGRNNAVMAGMVAALSDQDMKDLAVYFSQQETKAGSTPEELVAKGQMLYRAGDAEKGLTACTACHGPQGDGMPLAGFPKLSGQHADYTALQLKAFRDGQRANDLNGIMRDIAAKLSDKEIEALSHYVSGLH
ncbi:cytochrome c4 cytochrome C, class I in atlantica [Catenovulum agarivorans DS-2]|uniref:Cytochrome c4 cytochrome C, class I in atlantica n=1 Tax=Catenovulum agarivorans DS-2 TaxID=1328313 RepID=W7QSS3_9ALTE|nr:c-type cytochrome [Catenovulum agarivorans]EWH10923.1 cytochrome c4 cytochrome C, class I in atlantica [Catenovulum agarivorans DS-2]